jgi:hypothetical protein
LTADFHFLIFQGGNDSGHLQRGISPCCFHNLGYGASRSTFDKDSWITQDIMVGSLRYIIVMSEDEWLTNVVSSYGSLFKKTDCEIVLIFTLL